MEIYHRTEAIGGAHWGPVNVYMSKVADASTADRSTGWFKVHADSWAKRLEQLLRKDECEDSIRYCSGDFLLRAEVIALHVAGSTGGAQLYMSCCMSHPASLSSSPPIY
ncbi:hypothetical protein GMDG_03891 [Pseudogymnoascus destructans 20631-21]|uniref:AA9 family lytic polysaccharide monooxygenase n=1 Tax=Pseudogymnoascus destructans (strain ATCC MYA-4855 / 20631-21) TaxID=658429 RepID=L8G7W1_PSED2|nr:hypothetical protein GMDG_03891 [Pseudogymnoascus destructans 20631-21]